jgi:hypothetical protein
MGRRLEHERPEHRAAFAERGFAVRTRSTPTPSTVTFA